MLFVSLAANSQNVFDIDTVLYFEGTSNSAYGWYQEHWKCITNNSGKKDEFETTAQFNSRKERATRTCEKYNPLRNAEIRFGVRLNYDADTEMFRFALPIRNGGGRLIDGDWTGRTQNTISDQMTYFVGSEITDYDQNYFDGPPNLSIRYGGRNKSGFLDALGFTVKASINKARALKNKESSLQLVITGTSNFSTDSINETRTIVKGAFSIAEVSIVDLGTRRAIVSIR